MSPTVTRTLTATLVAPTAHKERKLQQLLLRYREALSEAFEADCTTMRAVNDVVTPYDLPYQAKDALKRYVPTLTGTYDAREIVEDHPIRFVNRAATFDHDPTREFVFCWRVPQPGRGTSFWIPLRINPEQEETWLAIMDNEADPGELRLQKGRSGWALHVTVKLPNEEPTESVENPTPIGIDIGESALVVGCALDSETPTTPRLWDGAHARRLRKEMHTTLQRLQNRDASTWRVEERFDHYQNALTDVIEKTTHGVIEYAQRFEHPIIVLEDLSKIRKDLDYGAFMNRRLHSWAFSRLQRRIDDKARDTGIPVRYVRAHYTSTICHACGHLGSRPNQATFRCRNEDCHISEFQADINAAANIASRIDPWGESVPLKPEPDDSPRDGSPRDRATERVDRGQPAR